MGTSVIGEAPARIQAPPEYCGALLSALLSAPLQVHSRVKERLCLLDLDPDDVSNIRQQY